VFSVTVFTALLGNGFQCRTFPFLWVPELSPAWPTATICLQTLSRLTRNGSWSSLCSLGTDRTENIASNTYSVVACVSAAAITWQIMSHCIATAVSAAFTILVYSRHVTIFGEDYKLWNSSLCSFLQSPVTSSLFGPNILLSALFSNYLSSSLNVRDQVLHPYRATGLPNLCESSWDKPRWSTEQVGSDGKTSGLLGWSGSNLGCDTVLTETVNDFPQSLQANSGTVPQIMQWKFPAMNFPIRYLTTFPQPSLVTTLGGAVFESSPSHGLSWRYLRFSSVPTGIFRVSASNRPQCFLPFDNTNYELLITSLYSKQINADVPNSTKTLLRPTQSALPFIWITVMRSDTALSPDKLHSK
jgi:hypothetical protein